MQLRQSNSVQPKNRTFVMTTLRNVSGFQSLLGRKYNVTSGQRILSLSHRDNLIQTLTMNITSMHYGYS